MKTLYDVLNKKEKKQIKKEFMEAKPNLYNRLFRLKLTGLSLILFCIIVIVFELINKDPNAKYFIIVYVFCLACGIFFISKSYHLFKNELNKLLKAKKSK